MSSTKELSDHGKFLRNAASREFENFRLAFEKYTEGVVLAVVASPGEDVVRAQGRAQQCLKILSVLEEIKNG